eukprot:scaffold7958_cov430-Prasinococcus_capsulatus_cf.AAC.1
MDDFGELNTEVSDDEILGDVEEEPNEAAKTGEAGDDEDDDLYADMSLPSANPTTVPIADTDRGELEASTAAVPPPAPTPEGGIPPEAGSPTASHSEGVYCYCRLFECH